MKKCKECKKEVRNKNWTSNSIGLCDRCYGRKKYKEKHPEFKAKVEKLESMSKKELIDLINERDVTIRHQIALRINRQAQIRNFRVRIKKIRDSLDYLLKCPYSNDTGFTTNKHKRDGARLSEHYQSRKQYARRKENDKGKNK